MLKGSRCYRMKEAFKTLSHSPLIMSYYMTCWSYFMKFYDNFQSIFNFSKDLLVFVSQRCEWTNNFLVWVHYSYKCQYLWWVKRRNSTIIHIIQSSWFDKYVEIKYICLILCLIVYQLQRKWFHIYAAIFVSRIVILTYVWKLRHTFLYLMDFNESAWFHFLLTLLFYKKSCCVFFNRIVWFEMVPTML